MYRISVLEYLETGKLHAVKAIKERLNLGLKEAKDWVESLPIRLDGEYTKEDVEWFKEHFNCDVTDTTHSGYFGYTPPEPSKETAEAIAWYDTLSAEDKAKVDLLIEWRGGLICVSGGGAAMVPSVFGDK